MLAGCEVEGGRGEGQRAHTLPIASLEKDQLVRRLNSTEMEGEHT